MTDTETFEELNKSLFMLFADSFGIHDSEMVNQTMKLFYIFFDEKIAERDVIIEGLKTEEKVFMQRLAERDDRIAELKALFKKSHEEQIMQIKYEVAIEFQKQVKEMGEKLSLAVEGLRFIKESTTHHGHHFEVVHKTARETLSKIES